MGVIALSLAMGSGQAQAAGKNDTINKGVYIGDVDVSGMTAEEAKTAVGEKVKSMGGKSLKLKVNDTEVTATAGELGMKWKNTDVVEDAIGLGKSGNIVKRYMDNKDLEHETKTYELDFTADSSAVKSYVENHCSQLNREAVEGSLTRENGAFVIVPGVVGLRVDVNKSADAIEKYMNETWEGESGTITLVAEEEIPRGTEEELSKVQDALGTATTYYGSTSGRNQNVEIGAEKLDGHLIYPGESFSVTEAVIPFTAENGYEMAPSYESGKVVDSYGGGICQVSTTLYNAILKAELEVEERSNHTMIVTYVDPSKDAAIAEGLMDLRFMNNTDAPIYIAGYAYGGELTFSIYGHETRSADRTVTYVSETLSSTNPEGVKLYAKPDQNVGYLKQIQGSHQGLTACLWKDVTENGETTRTKVNSSTYQAVPVSYEVGTNSSDPQVVAALQAAIAANDLNAVQSIIAGGGVSTPTAGTPQTESDSETQESETPKQSEETSGQTDTPPQDGTTQPPADPAPGGDGVGNVEVPSGDLPGE